MAVLTPHLSIITLSANEINSAKITVCTDIDSNNRIVINKAIICVEENELIKQIRWMKDNGFGGFFMHARGGLQTEYMGEEWFENVEACAAKCEENGMHAWAYDENGWPSGFGSGVVNGLGLDYQQKYLRWDKDISNTERKYREFCQMCVGYGADLDQVSVKRTSKNNWAVFVNDRRRFTASSNILDQAVVEKYNIKLKED